jgi:hypothetical protein
MSLTEYARVFPEAQTVIRMLLQELDRVAPGLFPDVYIVGSLALDEARPGKSDIDLVLVHPDTVTNEESMAALAPALELIRTMYPIPTLDALVLSRADLAAGPDAMQGPRPVIFEGRLSLQAESSVRNPVAWQTLRQRGITWRGVPIRELDLHVDADRLREWTRGNLESYWRPWLAKSAILLSPGGQWSLRPDFVEWGVLGVTRLHATIATGEIVSKTGAGHYALRVFGEKWHPIIREALEIRANPERTASLYGRRTLRRRRDARAYVAMVIEDALAL